MTKILHIDDELDHLNLTRIYLKAEKPEYEIDIAETSSKALELVREKEYECILLDYVMPEMNGINLAIEIKKITETPIVIYTARGNEEVAERAFEYGIEAYIQKLTDLKDYHLLAQRIDKIIENYRRDKFHRNSVERFTKFMASATDGFSILDRNLIYIDVNQVLLEWSGLSREEIIGKNLKEISPEAVESGRYDKYLEVIETGKSIVFESIHPKFGDRYIKVKAFKVGEGLGLISSDVTAKVVNKRKIEALLDVVSKTYQTDSLEDICENTLEIIDELFGFPGSGILFVNGDYLEEKCTRGVPLKSHFKVPLDGKGITVRAVKTGEIQKVDDIREDLDYIRGEIPNEVMYLSELAVPIIVGDQVFGVLNLESEEICAFNDEDVMLFDILSKFLSLSFFRIKHNEFLHSFNSVRISQISSWYDNMFSMYRHDLKTPLINIKSAANLIDVSDEQEELINMITRNADSCIEILDDWKNQSDISTVRKEKTDLNQLLHRAINNVFIKRSIQVNIDVPEATIQLDRTKIYRVFINLIKNAIDAMPDGGRLIINAEKSEDSILLRFTDNGVGISPDNLDKVFLPFFTTKPDGTGLGLTYCKQIIELHGGTIKVGSEPSSGTVITINLPKK